MVALVVVVLATAVTAVANRNAGHKAADQSKPTPSASVQPEPSFAAAYKQAQPLAQAKNYSAAVKLWKGYLAKARLKSNQYAAYNQLALLYDQEQDYASATDSYQNMVKRADKPSFYDNYFLAQAAEKEAYAIAGKPGFDTGKALSYFQIAIFAYQQALPLAPDSAMRKTLTGKVDSLQKTASTISAQKR